MRLPEAAARRPATRAAGAVALRSSPSFVSRARASSRRRGGGVGWLWIGRSGAHGLAVVWLVALCTWLSACSPGNLLRQFEYEEEMYLDLDGSATVVVNASLPALALLRGLPLDVDARARVDRARIRQLFEAPGVDVTRVSRPWRRRGRRFVQVRLRAEDVTHLARIAPLAWSEYELERQGGLVVYRQIVNEPAKTLPVDVGWSGRELVGFRLHLPSRILYHNATTRRVERGNILSWEQPLADRLAGTPLRMEVRMEEETILFRTLTIFVTAAAAALLLLAAAIGWIWKKGRASRLTAATPPDAA